MFKLDGQIDGMNYTIKADYSDIPLEGSFDFGSEEENQKYMERFENEELLNLDISVEVYSNSGYVSGSDHLGSCHLAVNDLENGIQEMVKDHAMLDNAMEDLKATLKQIENKDLKAYNLK